MDEKLAGLEKFLLDQAQQNNNFIQYLKETSVKLEEEIASIKENFIENLEQRQLQRKNKEYPLQNSHVNFKKINLGGYDYFICKLCRKCFVDYQTIFQHLEKAHSHQFQVLPCDICGILFIGDLSLVNHKIKDHLKCMLKSKKEKKEKEQP
ncbi:hypothetical protein pb186bvf_003650 [Paramecium bursaria]